MSLQSATPIAGNEPSKQRSGQKKAAFSLKFSLNDPTLRFVALVVLFTFPAVFLLHDFHMDDPDFGWHLRAGQWILSHHSVPTADPFSSYGAGKPWYDYSWLFDVFFALLYRAFGLLGFVYLEVAIRVAIPAFIYRMAKRIGLAFWPSVICAALAAYSFTSIYAPRPGMFSILFLAVELELLFVALLEGSVDRLYWL